MWTFLTTARIENNWGQWCALVTLEKDGIPESFFVTFDAEPTLAQADTAGTELALRKTLKEAPSMGLLSITREDFFSRFTNSEIANIYRASAASDDLFAYVKKLEINPTVNINHPDVVSGLNLLESVGLLAAGRANQIRGA